jgi:carbohydrate kinase (thermoresistant glucokinase family)
MDGHQPVSSIIVMGVSGAGKSSVGAALAKRMGYEFIEGDRLHSAHNVERMASGHALSDEERLPWLNLVGAAMQRVTSQHRGVVAACSALKRSYRDVLRTYCPATFFALLDAPIQVIEARVLARRDSFMPPSLLASQIDTLEPLQDDELGMRVDAALSPADIVSLIEQALKGRGSLS